MKGIVLAGGEGSRLYPATKVISKQLLPVHDKPMIYYSLSVLMLAGITEILIISTSKFLPLYKELFGNGSHLGLDIDYASQNTPRGIAEAFLIGENFIGKDSVCLILGDNIFYGNRLSHILQTTRMQVDKEGGAVIFCYRVENPKCFGVIEFDMNQNVISIEEKPPTPKTNYAVTGLYFYDNDVIGFTKSMELSERGELEVTDINIKYMEQKRLKARWFDSGTIETLRESGNFIASIEEKRSVKIGCIEEIAYKQGLITAGQLIELANLNDTNDYSKYLKNVAGSYDAF